MAYSTGPTTTGEREEGGQDESPQSPFDHNPDPISQHVCLLHGVRGQNNDPVSLHSANELPHFQSILNVHSGGLRRESWPTY